MLFSPQLKKYEKTSFAPDFFIYSHRMQKTQANINLFDKVEKAFFHILAIASYFHDLYFPHSKPFWKLEQIF